MPIEAVLRKIAAAKKAAQIEKDFGETPISGDAESTTRLSIQPAKEFPFLSLAATRFKQVGAPIQLRPGVTVIDIDSFIERTLQDLASYVSAANRGSKHWVATLLDEKIEDLELCGIKAEIRKIH